MRGLDRVHAPDYIGSWLSYVVAQDVLEVGSRDLDLQFAASRHRYSPRLLAHNHANRVGDLTHAECRAVTQAEILGNVHVMAHRQDAPRSRDPVARYYHRAVVQRRILEENILYEANVDVGVDAVAGLLILRQRHLALEDYQRAGLRLRHGHAGVDHAHHLRMVAVVVLLMPEQLHEAAQVAVGAYVDEHTLYLVLEEDDEHYQADAHELVDDRAREPHVEDLIRHHPHDDEGEHAVEQRERAAVLHQAVKVEEKQGDYQDVDYVFDSELYHCERVYQILSIVAGPPASVTHIEWRGWRLRLYASKILTVSAAWRTSWTLRMSAPLTRASILTAVVPLSASSGVTPSSFQIIVLRETPASSGHPSARNAPSAPSSA